MTSSPDVRPWTALADVLEAWAIADDHAPELYEGDREWAEALARYLLQNVPALRVSRPEPAPSLEDELLRAVAPPTEPLLIALGAALPGIEYQVKRTNSGIWRALLEAAREALSTQPLAPRSEPSLVERAIEIAQEKVGFRSDVSMHDYGGHSVPDGVHRADCRWCAIVRDARGAVDS